MIVAILPQAAAVALFSLTPSPIIVLLLIIPMTWWGVTLYLMPAAVAASRSGANPIRVAFEVQRGRWWRIFWRIALIGVMMSMALNVVLAALIAAIPDSGYGLGGAFVAMVALSLLVLSAYLPYGAATVSIVYDVMPEQDRELVGEATAT